MIAFLACSNVTSSQAGVQSTDFSRVVPSPEEKARLKVGTLNACVVSCSAESNALSCKVVPGTSRLFAGRCCSYCRSLLPCCTRRRHGRGCHRHPTHFRV